MPSVPFSIPRLFCGMVECHGLIRGDGDCLCLEYQMQDGFWGMFKRRPRAVRIPLSQLESVELQRRGWFGRKGVLVIKAKSLVPLAGVPGSRQGQVELAIAPHDRKAAEQFVAGLYE
jgi:hypothetical protein